MKTPDLRRCTEEELWKYIGYYLAKADIDSVLVGGAVVAVYSKGAYHSGDLDFIAGSGTRPQIESVLKEIGFISVRSRHFKHPDCSHLIVEFPPGPLSIGDDYQIKPNEVKIKGKTLRILSPTDCIRDRLASFIHFKARECLEQAVLVAKSQPFNVGKIRKWCEAEGAFEAFEQFKDKIRTDNFVSETAHPWRLCPAGEHAVRTHPLRIPPGRRSSPVGSITTRHWHCAKNPSGKDQLYPLEIKEIAKQYFCKLKNKPCSLALSFPNGATYDDYIAGWTHYWNEIFRPVEPLDPNLVKALIASESGFKPRLLADKTDPDSARGLMQITNTTRKILSDENGDLKDHYVTVTREELNDPNINICAGIRWLFEKNVLAKRELKRNPNWVETVAEFKGILKRWKKTKGATKQMDPFLKYLEKFKTCKK